MPGRNRTQFISRNKRKEDEPGPQGNFPGIDQKDPIIARPTTKLMERKVTTTTTTDDYFGKEVHKKTVTIEELTYEDVGEEEGLKKRIKQTLKQFSFPNDLKPHAETFMSTVFADVKKYWDEQTGDVTYAMQKAGIRVEVNVPVSDVGKILKERTITGKRMLAMVKTAFVNSNGEGNPDFMEALEEIVNQRMGIVEERKEPPKDETF